MKRFVAIVTLMAVLVSVAMIVQMPTARAQVGPKTITVDGDPSDWTGVPSPLADTAIENGGEYIWTDATVDDTGAGAYTYPTNAVFVPGTFDLTEVRVTADADNLYFLIRIADLTNPWISDPGISLQKFGIFLDTGTGGLTAAAPNLVTGTDFEYSAIVAQATWQPENAKIFNAAGDWWPIGYAADSTNEAIEVSLPLQFIGDPSGQTWGIYLWIGGQDGFGPGGWRDVTAAGGEWAFGGGSDTLFDPAVVDLAFSTTQAAELDSYDDSTSSQATVTSMASVTFGSVGFVPDATDPTLSAIMSEPSFNQAAITWTTDELATTKLVWGTASGQLTNTITGDVVTDHAVLITGLSPTTTYYYAVESTDVAGNTATSAEDSFTTSLAPPRNFAEWIGDTFHWADNYADDVGDADYTYPQNGGALRWVGKADITDVSFSNTTTAVHLNVKNFARPTPNTDSDPWRQRMAGVAIFIDQDHVFGSGGRSVGLVGTGAELTDPHPMNLSVAANFAFEYLVVANFQNRSAVGDARGIGEMLIFNSTWNEAQQRWSLIYVSTAPQFSPEPDAGQIYAKDGTDVDIWLNYSVFGNTDNWTYVIAGMLYDDAARTFDEGGIRQVRPTGGDWIGGGSNGPYNANVYDLAFYPDVESQMEDLSAYRTTGSYPNVTRALQVNIRDQWYQLLAVPTMTSTLSVNSIGAGETAALTAFLSTADGPVADASVTLAVDPSTAVDITSANPATTNEFGAAMFTLRGRALETATPVTLTLTAAVGSLSAGSEATLTVRAFAHNYLLFASAADGVLATSASTSVSVVFTDRGSPIAGASVGLVSANAAVLSVVSASATTDSQGRATFSIRAGYTETDVPVTLTATATNGSASAMATVSVTVKAFVHAYAVTGSAATSVVAAGQDVVLTFTVRDAGNVRAGLTVSISLAPSGVFDIVGDAAKATAANGQVTFTLRARTVTADTAAVVTATVANGTAQNLATSTLTVVAQAPAPAGGVAVEVFGGVSVLLAILAAVFAAMWIRGRRAKPPPQPPEQRPPEEELGDL